MLHPGFFFTVLEKPLFSSENRYFNRWFGKLSSDRSWETIARRELHSALCTSLITPKRSFSFFERSISIAFQRNYYFLFVKIDVHVRQSGHWSKTRYQQSWERDMACEGKFMFHRNHIAILQAVFDLFPLLSVWIWGSLFFCRCLTLSRSVGEACLNRKIMVLLERMDRC